MNNNEYIEYVKTLNHLDLLNKEKIEDLIVEYASNKETTITQLKNILEIPLIKNKIPVYNEVFQNSLSAACKCGNVSIVKYLIEEKEQNLVFNKDYPLRAACEAGQLDVVKFLISKGANIYGGHGGSISHAVISENIDLIDYLISIDADLHQDYEKALYNAVINNKLNMVKYLQGLGSNIHHNNDIFLELSCEYGLLDIVKYLLENDADMNVRDKSPLFKSACRDRFEVMEYLLEKGCYLNEKEMGHDMTDSISISTKEWLIKLQKSKKLVDKLNVNLEEKYSAVKKVKI